jgi:hypothetical protein
MQKNTRSDHIWKPPGQNARLIYQSWIRRNRSLSQCTTRRRIKHVNYVRGYVIYVGIVSNCLYFHVSVNQKRDSMLS